MLDILISSVVRVSYLPPLKSPAQRPGFFAAGLVALSSDGGLCFTTLPRAASKRSSLSSQPSWRASSTNLPAWLLCFDGRFFWSDIMLLPRPERIAPDRAQIREIYLDETSQTKHRYLLIGGVVTPLLSAEAAGQAIVRSKVPELTHGEMKWGKVSTSKLPAYRRVVDCFFDSEEFSAIDFHSIVVDTTLIRDRAFNEGNREIGFNKEIYQIATKCARLYPSLFHLYPDQRETSQLPNDLRQILNNGRRKQGDQREFPFRRCQFRDSKDTLLLQISDIFIGAIAYQLNGHINANGASPAKSELSQHVLARARVQNPFVDTAVRGKFTIWHRQLRRA